MKNYTFTGNGKQDGFRFYNKRFESDLEAIKWAIERKYIKVETIIDGHKIDITDKYETYPKIVFDTDNNEKEYFVYKEYNVGDTMRSDYAAPGIGHKIVKFIAKDGDYIYAEIIEDTCRILEPWECE